MSGALNLRDVNLTRSFKSTPDNAQLSLTYTDPATGQNKTCTDRCPLSTDPNVSAQDFIFTNGPKELTGLQMQLKEWIGAGAGLSSVQLLSDGSSYHWVIHAIR